MKRYLICLICLLCFINAFSQNRNKIWYFGQNAGLDFSTNPPTPLSNSTMDQLEGCATMCDNSGQLLFYSDGISVWNRNHQVMLNGTDLLGYLSSTQSALIIPNPSDNNIYYIFTVPTFGGSIPFSYSIIDMTLDGGLGGITTKNVALHLPVLEKLVGTLKANGTDYWVIVKEQGTDAFYAYSVTATGVDPNPVISHTGIVPPDPFDTQGWARVSPDGSKFCIGYMYTGLAQLFDFNNSTGILSNPMDLVTSTIAFHGPYGIEFSADNSKLYLMEELGGIVRQYDLLAGSPTAIQNSVVQIAELAPADYGGAIVRGPDDKIYISNTYTNNISIINQPNLPGIACNYVFQGVQLLPGTSNSLGLPNTVNFAANTCAAALNINNSINICANQSYQLPSGTVVSVSGVYQDTIRNIANTCDSIIYNIHLSVSTLSLISTNAHICANQTYQLPSGAVVGTTGIYLDTLRNQEHCDSIINTVNLTVNDFSYTDQFDSISAGQNYTLPSGVIVNSAGIYQSVLSNSLGCDSIITTTLTLKQPIAECITLKNAITPNGDGINDYWVLYRSNCFKRLDVCVYNRYGSLVYHSDDYKNDWSGRYKNKELPDGTYYYVVKVIAFDGKEHVFKDNVTILR